MTSAKGSTDEWPEEWGEDREAEAIQRRKDRTTTCPTCAGSGRSSEQQP